MYFLAIWMSSLEKLLFGSPFFNWINLFVYLLIWGYDIVSSLYIFNINCLSDMGFANIFSHSITSLSILLMASFAEQELFDLM